MIILSILPKSLIHFFFKGWENVIFELLVVKGLILVPEDQNSGPGLCQWSRKPELAFGRLKLLTLNGPKFV